MPSALGSSKLKEVKPNVLKRPVSIAVEPRYAVSQPTLEWDLSKETAELVRDTFSVPRTILGPVPTNISLSCVQLAINAYPVMKMATIQKGRFFVCFI